MRFVTALIELEWNPAIFDQPQLNMARFLTVMEEPDFQIRPQTLCYHIHKCIPSFLTLAGALICRLFVINHKF